MSTENTTKPITEWLCDLIKRVPVHVIDLVAAQRSGDAAALAYTRGIREWQAEAALALAEAAQEAQPSASRHPTPDAYVRAGLASALLTEHAVN